MDGNGMAVVDTDDYNKVEDLLDYNHPFANKNTRTIGVGVNIHEISTIDTQDNCFVCSFTVYMKWELHQKADHASALVLFRDHRDNSDIMKNQKENQAVFIRLKIILQGQDLSCEVASYSARDGYIKAEESYGEI